MPSVDLEMCPEMWDVSGDVGCVGRCGMCPEMWDVSRDVGCVGRCVMCGDMRGGVQKIERCG